MPEPRTVLVESFGYGFGPAPATAHLVFDVRQHFRDPHFDPELRQLRATDERIVRAVLGTPGVVGLIEAIAAAAAAYCDGPVKEPVQVAIGCVGGRHRSAVIASAVSRRLHHAHGLRGAVSHRDMGRPVIERPAAAAPEVGRDLAALIADAAARLCRVCGALESACRYELAEPARTGWHLARFTFQGPAEINTATQAATEPRESGVVWLSGDHEITAHAEWVAWVGGQQ